MAYDLGRDAVQILSAMGGAAPRATSWKDGLAAAYELDLSRRRIFVSPEVRGFVFVVGPMALPAAITERTVLSIAGAWGTSPITLAEIEQSGDGCGRLADIRI